ncbi:hypothetical protein GY45DRAFT_951996 [Cubamyces sp. BRFM 1775]|nr:hypothetical protein GY45DRAFT_951996 [Cubamyces sp. BRFM 1775]
MLPSLAARVLSRVYMPSGLLAGSHFTAIAPQRVIARTMTSVKSRPGLEPGAAAKDNDAVDTKPAVKKAAAKKSASSATKEKVAATKKTGGKKATEETASAKRKAETAKKRAAALQEKERARMARQKAREEKAKQREARKKKIAAAQDPLRRLKLPLRAVKIPKDQQPPKAPPNAYMVFVREYLEKLGVAGKSTEEMKVIMADGARTWKALDEEAKKEYFNKAAVLKQEYAERVTEWYKTAHPRYIKAAKLQWTRVGKISDELKRPMPPYVRYLKEQWHSVESCGGATAQEELSLRGKKIAEMWQATSAEEKERYRVLFNAEMEEYRKREAEQAAAALSQAS